MSERAAIILHSGDMDKVYSALIIATGALSMGMECSIYFTFWGLDRLKEGELESGGLSRMNMLGLGKLFMTRRMEGANVQSLGELLEDFRELGGKVIACEMTMEVMGLKEEDLDTSVIDEFGAVGTYIEEARDSDLNLFI